MRSDSQKILQLEIGELLWARIGPAARSGWSGSSGELRAGRNKQSGLQLPSGRRKGAIDALLRLKEEIRAVQLQVEQAKAQLRTSTGRQLEYGTWPTSTRSSGQRGGPQRETRKEPVAVRRLPRRTIRRGDRPSDRHPGGPLWCRAKWRKLRISKRSCTG